MMKEIWVWVQAALAAVGGALGWFLGGWDGFLYALLAFVVLDYLTGRAVRDCRQTAFQRNRLQGHLP